MKKRTAFSSRRHLLHDRLGAGPEWRRTEISTLRPVDGAQDHRCKPPMSSIGVFRRRSISIAALVPARVAGPQPVQGELAWLSRGGTSSGPHAAPVCDGTRAAGPISCGRRRLPSRAPLCDRVEWRRDGRMREGHEISPPVGRIADDTDATFPQPVGISLRASRTVTVQNRRRMGRGDRACDRGA